jgi:hypothetical protein
MTHALLPLRAAFDDPLLLQPLMGGPSREAMRALLLASQGEELTDAEREHWRALTLRDREPLERVEETHIIGGRRSGKSSGVSALAIYAATLVDYSDLLTIGERPVVLVIAENQRQARIVLRYIEGGLANSPVFSKLVVGRTASSITLDNGVAIEVHAADFRAIRGISLAMVIVDEIAFLRNENSANPDYEIVDAIRPGLATLRGQLFTIGSPYAKRGVQYDVFVKHHGPAGDPSVIVAKGSTRQFNETVPQKIIDRAYARDSVSADSEWGGNFRNDIAAFVSREIVEAAVPPGVFEIPYIAGGDYFAFTDPSGGSSDSFTLAIATSRPSPDNEDAMRGELVCLREFFPPFSPDSVVSEICKTLGDYGLDKVVGDRYGGGFPPERFKEHGVAYEPSELPKSQIYADSLPLLNAGRVTLLDSKRLVSQLCGLERRTGRGTGKESIDHGPGAHDDLANSAMGALLLAAGKRSSGWIWEHL